MELRRDAPQRGSLSVRVGQGSSSGLLWSGAEAVSGAFIGHRGGEARAPRVAQGASGAERVRRVTPLLARAHRAGSDAEQAFIAFVGERARGTLDLLPALQ